MALGCGQIGVTSMTSVSEMEFTLAFKKSVSVVTVSENTIIDLPTHARVRVMTTMDTI